MTIKKQEKSFDVLLFTNFIENANPVIYNKNRKKLQLKGAKMEIKAKHIVYVGAFIVLAIVGANFIKDDSVVITSEEMNNSVSGEVLEEYIYVHIDGAIKEPRNKESS